MNVDEKTGAIDKVKGEFDKLEISPDPLTVKTEVEWDDILVKLKQEILDKKFPINHLLSLNHFTYRLWLEAKDREEIKFADDYQDGYEKKEYSKYRTVDSCYDYDKYDDKYDYGTKQTKLKDNELGNDDFKDIMNDVKSNSDKDEKVLDEYRKQQRNRG
jgi:hypothetical protein